MFNFSGSAAVPIDVSFGLMLGTAFGDAFGIPYENKTYAECEGVRESWIKSLEGVEPPKEEGEAKKEEIVGGGKRVRKHLSPFAFDQCTDHPFISAGFEPSRWTDDTQLTMAMARALGLVNSQGHPVGSTAAEEGQGATLHAAGLQYHRVALEHVTEYHRSLEGWGGTSRAIGRLVDPVEKFMEKGQPNSPTVFSAHRISGNTKAVGNGVLMKLTPLAVAFASELWMLYQNDIARKSAFQNFAEYVHSLHILPRQQGGKELRGVRLSSSDQQQEAIKYLRDSQLRKQRIQTWLELCQMTHLSPESEMATILHGEMMVALFFRAQLSPSSLHSAAVLLSEEENKKTNFGEKQPDPQELKAKQLSHEFKGLITKVFKDGLDVCSQITAVSSPIELLAEYNFKSQPSDVQEVTQVLISKLTALMELSASRISHHFVESPKSNAMTNGNQPSSSSLTETGPRPRRNSKVTFQELPNGEAEKQQQNKTTKDEEEDKDESGLYYFQKANKQSRILLEDELVQISEGGTYFCLHSATMIWGYLICIAPHFFAGDCRHAVPTYSPGDGLLITTYATLLGGDTDSNAAILGGILGVLFGASTFGMKQQQNQQGSPRNETTNSPSTTPTSKLHRQGSAGGGIQLYREDLLKEAAFRLSSLLSHHQTCLTIVRRKANRKRKMTVGFIAMILVPMLLRWTVNVGRTMMSSNGTSTLLIKLKFLILSLLSMLVLGTTGKVMQLK